MHVAICWAVSFMFLLPAYVPTVWFVLWEVPTPPEPCLSCGRTTHLAVSVDKFGATMPRFTGIAAVSEVRTVGGRGACYKLNCLSRGQAVDCWLLAGEAQPQMQPKAFLAVGSTQRTGKLCPDLLPSCGKEHKHRCLPVVLSWKQTTEI